VPGGIALALFRITKSGLFAITLSVLALWGSIALEATLRNRGAADARTVVRTLQQLRERGVPASEPVPRFRPQAVKSA
jgi:hypothetical protein